MFGFGFSGGGGASSAFDLPSVRVSGARGDGVADDTAAIKAAHDAAVAAGGRMVWFPRGTYNAPGLLGVGDAMFVGPGLLKGAYRKRVVPLSAPAHVIPGEVIPALHLRRFAAASAPVVVLMGDSTGTPADVAARSEGLWPALQRAIRRDNPGRAIAFANRSVPSTAWAHADTKPGTFYPAFAPWYADQSRDWLAYVADLAPDLVILNFGTNDASGFTGVRMKNVIDKLRALPKVPDLIVVTNLQRSNMADGADERAAQEARDYPAGWARTYARYLGLGLIDLHRQSVLAREGYDLGRQPMEAILAAVPLTWPWTAPEECADFEIDFTLDNTGGSAIDAAARRIDIGLSPKSDCLVRIAATGPSPGSWTMLHYGGNGQLIWTVNTSLPVPSGPVQFVVSARGGSLSIEANGVELYAGPCVRHGGLFQPVLRYASTTPLPFTLNRFSVGRPALAMPVLTDAELWGLDGPGGPFGGNNVNHPTSRLLAAVHAPVLERTRFAAAEVPPGA